jgi:hypothetical protein
MDARASRKCKRADSTDEMPDAKRVPSNSREILAQASPLLDIPDDLMGTVVGFLTDPVDLDRFARLRRSFYYVVAVHAPRVPLAPLRISKLTDFVIYITKATLRHVQDIEFSRMHSPRHAMPHDPYWAHQMRVGLARDRMLRNRMLMIVGNLRSLVIDGESPFSVRSLTTILPMAKELERVRLDVSPAKLTQCENDGTYTDAGMQDLIDAIVELVSCQSCVRCTWALPPKSNPCL